MNCTVHGSPLPVAEARTVLFKTRDGAMSRRELPARAASLLLVICIAVACLPSLVAAQSVEITLNADFAAAPVLYEARYRTELSMRIANRLRGCEAAAQYQR